MNEKEYSNISKLLPFANDNKSVDKAKYHAISIRKKILSISFAANTPHIGSSLSCVDIISAFFVCNKFDINNQDEIFLLSKGHAAPALYSALEEFGIISKESLDKFGLSDSILEEHPNHFIPGVPHPSGSLGHGLGFGAGFVLSGRTLSRERRATIILSDGECNEGTVWEAALFAGAKSLVGLTAIIDQNGLQATGSIDETYGKAQIAQLFKASGWTTLTINGHRHQEIISALKYAKTVKDSPVCIVAKTIKGRGVSFMENNNNWHYRTLDQESFHAALDEIESIPK